MGLCLHLCCGVRQRRHARGGLVHVCCRLLKPQLPQLLERSVALYQRHRAVSESHPMALGLVTRCCGGCCCGSRAQSHPSLPPAMASAADALSPSGCHTPGKTWHPLQSHCHKHTILQQVSVFAKLQQMRFCEMAVLPSRSEHGHSPLLPTAEPPLLPALDLLGPLLNHNCDPIRCQLQEYFGAL